MSCRLERCELMPGIVGYIDFSEKAEKKGCYLDKMLRSITHDTGYRIDKYENQPLWVGRSDLPTHNPYPQPVFNQDKSMLVMFQGNITNRKEIDKHGGDTQTAKNCNNAELLLRLIEKQDTEFLTEVKGQFTAVIWDLKNKSLIIANDRFGRYPLYYSRISRYEFVFGSELKALLLYPSLKKRLNDNAIVDFIRFGWLWENETFFQNVHLIPYASILHFKKGHFDIKQYWEYRLSENYEETSLDEYIGKLNELIKKAVKRAVEGCHTNIGILLSGGLDSRIIAANIPKEKGNIHTFTFGEEGCSDVKFAETLSKILGFKHHCYCLSSNYIPKYSQATIYILDGMTYIFTGQNFVLARALDKEKIDLVLEGSSAGTVFGSFLNTIKSFIAQTCDSYSRDDLYKELLKKLSIFSDKELREALSPEYYEKVKVFTRKSFRQCFNRSIKLQKLPNNIVNYIVFTQRLRRWSITARLSFGWKVETVDPFLDYDLIDFMLTVPPKLRLYKYKSLFSETFKRYHKDLARIPLRLAYPQMEYCLVSSKFRKSMMMARGLAAYATRRFIQMIARGRPLLSFIKFPWDPTNYNQYLREQEDYVRKILLDKRTLSRGIFNPEYIKRILDLHMSKKKDYWNKIGILLSLELWFRLFIDRIQPVIDETWEWH